MLRAFAPRLRRGGRLIIVASSLGTLDKLDDRVAGHFADAAESLDAVDSLVAGSTRRARKILVTVTKIMERLATARRVMAEEVDSSTDVS